jgi:hypothetical protein
MGADGALAAGLPAETGMSKQASDILHDTLTELGWYSDGGIGSEKECCELLQRTFVRVVEFCCSQPMTAQVERVLVYQMTINWIDFPEAMQEALRTTVMEWIQRDGIESGPLYEWVVAI